MLYMFFQYGWEPVLIQRLLYFEALLEIIINSLISFFLCYPPILNFYMWSINYSIIFKLFLINYYFFPAWCPNAWTAYINLHQTNSIWYSLLHRVYCSSWLWIFFSNCSGIQIVILWIFYLPQLQFMVKYYW